MQKICFGKTNKRRNNREIKSRFAGRLYKVLLLLLIVVLGVIGAGTFTVVYSFVNDAPNLGNLKTQIPAASRIYDRFENEIAIFYGLENRIEKPLDEISPHVQNAFIAIEDERFYKHCGLDLLGLTRAFITNLRRGDWTGQGGSTITQQLVKNTLLSQEKTFSRKLKEAWLAINMERRYSKSEILEMYLNQIYFAHGAYGVEAAARIYFGKSAAELTVGEAALLAGIPRSPNYYSPYNNLEAALQRQSLVLEKMFELDYISEGQLKEARGERITLAGFPGREYPFPYFMDYVLHEELVEILTGLPGINSQADAYKTIYSGGLKIYTTLDPDAQSLAEGVLNEESLYPRSVRVDMECMKQLLNNGDYTGYPEEALDAGGVPQPQAAVVMADPVTGEVLALVGGREYGEGNQDLRYLRPRQPGSAMKPIAVYVPAVEEGLITPGSIIDDSPVAWGDWTPENFGGDFLGLVTVREALVRSLNVPAVKLFAHLTPEVGLEYAQKMGITTIHPDDYNLAASLGGLTWGTTAFGMAQAYCVLANEGKKADLHTVKKIEDRNGHVLYEHSAQAEQVISPQTAYLVTDMLKDVVLRGTASNLNIIRPLAAKTGTTSENRDAYLVAYTPDIVVSFWMGHDIQKLGRIDGGSGEAVPFMNAILSQVLEDVPSRDFRVPLGITGPVSICSKSGLRPGPHCPEEDIVEEIFPAGKAPGRRCDLHIELEICTRSGLLASYNCPPWERVRRIFLLRPDYELTDERWGVAGRGPKDAAFLPPARYCDVHGWWRIAIGFGN
ncbi:MAG TPA: PBP1A family penicillin-binding protein [Firmicutes bacterium]|jgi:penicillin-binding protein 1A|nr:PBP1A family penicillin-binding protein [Bacillota bacterium]